MPVLLQQQETQSSYPFQSKGVFKPLKLSRPLSLTPDQAPKIPIVMPVSLNQEDFGPIDQIRSLSYKLNKNTALNQKRPKVVEQQDLTQQYYDGEKLKMLKSKTLSDLKSVEKAHKFFEPNSPLDTYKTKLSKKS